MNTEISSLVLLKVRTASIIIEDAVMVSLNAVMNVVIKKLQTGKKWTDFNPGITGHCPKAEV